MNNWNNLSMAQRAGVMRLAVENGVYDLDTIRGAYNEFAKGGSIHIKPESRGKFTRLKERTGHSATWFKEHGTPAQRKMAIFALNARHWKHGLGGPLVEAANIYDGTTENSQQMNRGWFDFSTDNVFPSRSYSADTEPIQQMNSWVANYNSTPVSTTSSYAPNGRYGINGKPYEQWAEEKKAAVAAQEWADNQPQLKPMTMTKKEREIAKVKGDRNAEYERKQELQRKGVEALGILGTFARPSTWAALPFTGIERFGEGFGTEWVNTPIDLVTPFAWNKGTQVISNIPYKEYRLSRAINKAVKENPVITGYNRNPALKDVGDLWDYQTYLKQVYPNTKVKDVQWHGSIIKNLQNFSTNAIGTNTPIKGSVGMYLAPERYTTSTYGRKGGIYPVLLNTENPYITNQIFALSKNGVNVAKITPEVKNTLLAENDAVIAPRRGEIAFFNPDNALILGSDKDLQGFRTFMNEPKGLLSDEPLVAKDVNDIRKFEVPFFDLNIDALKAGIEHQIAENQWRGLTRGENDVFNYLGSEKHINRIMESGVPRERATRIAQDMRDNAMATDRAIDYTGGEGAYHNVGEYDNGFFDNHRLTLNPRYTVMKGLDEQSTYENVIHELGGHGATLGYKPGSYSNISERAAKWYEDAMTEWSPYHKEVYEHNSSLKPVRKPEYEGVKDPHIEYLEGVDEYSTRARAANIDSNGSNRGDFSELYKYFTKESVDKLKNGVWGLVPFIGLGTLGTMYGVSTDKTSYR